MLQKKWLIYAPVIIFNLWILFKVAFPKATIAAILMIIVMIACELKGLICFWGRYISYQYSSLTIFTKEGNQIECKDVSRIKRKKDIFVVKKEDCEIYTRYEDISRIEYSGKELVLLKHII